MDRQKIAELKNKFLLELKKIYDTNSADEKFVPGVTKIPLSCRTYEAEDVAESLEAILSDWPTMGKKVEKCEEKLAAYLNVKNAIMTSSGGAANFLILNFLTSPFVNEKDSIAPGDEIITPAVTWSTTVSPIIQVGCVPVLADVNMGTYDIKTDEIEKLITKRTHALMIVQPLGNVCDMDKILEITEKHDLVLIEDSCESLGSDDESWSFSMQN